MFLISTIALDATGHAVKLYYRHFMDQTLGLFSGPWTMDRNNNDIYKFATEDEAIRHAKLNIISKVKIEQV